MLAARPRHLASRLQLLLSALGIAVVLLLAASTHSPGLHAWFHPADDSCSSAHGPSSAPTSTAEEGDRCAVVLFAQGVTEFPTALLTHTERLLAGRLLPSPPPAPRLAPPPHAHPPSHAPPDCLRLHAVSFKINSRPVAGPHSKPHHAPTLFSR